MALIKTNSRSLSPDTAFGLQPKNLLINGASGIAVGMATNIAPHNLGEVIDASLFLIKNPDCNINDLQKYIFGPDFPTGGQIIGKKVINEAFET